MDIELDESFNSYHRLNLNKLTLTLSSFEFWFVIDKLKYEM